MKDSWPDSDDIDDALLPPEDELSDLADELGWSPESDLPVEDED